MVSFLEIVFTTVFVIWAGRLVFRQKWNGGYKAAAFLLGAFFLFAIWNRPLGGHWGLPDFNPLVAVLASVGAVIAGDWAHDKWGPDWRVTSGIVAVTLGFILLFCWPFFTAGTSSVAPIAPAPPAPVASPPPSPPTNPTPARPISRPRRPATPEPEQTYDACIRNGYPADFCSDL